MARSTKWTSAVIVYRKTYIYAKSTEDLRDLVRGLGSCEKNYLGETLYVEKNFGPRVELNVTASRELACRKIKTGEKIVPAHVVPAEPEHEVPEQVVEEFEWDCSDPLLAETGSTEDEDLPF